jgi:DNA polymerase (family 10)
MINSKVVGMLEEIADLLETRKDNPFKIRSYRTAARNISTLDQDLGELEEEGRLREIPGVGDAIAEKIREIIGTGDLDYLRRLKKEVLGPEEPLMMSPSGEKKG